MLSDKINRRDFLQKSGVITAGTLLLPTFLKGAPANDPNGKRLVVIQLSGGNDGLNTVIHFQNDILYNARPKLGLRENEIIKLSDEVGINAVMNGFRDLYDEGDACIINSVGYPNPNRSHFRSMDIWHSASDSDKYWEHGWLGRYLDNECSESDKLTGIEIGSVLSRAMKGKDFSGIPITDINQFYRSANQIDQLDHNHDDHEMASYLYKTLAETKNSATYLYEKNKIFRSKKDYPQTQLGRQLKKVSEMIISGVESPVYYVSLGGFDTHNWQKDRQNRLLGVYSVALKAFVDELKEYNQWDNTLVMTFSEFGRRVRQNASGGTDHGKANNVFLLSGSLKKQGFYNEMPDLSNLDGGDVKHQIDFRQIYATILDNWLNSRPNEILKAEFSTLGFI